MVIKMDSKEETEKTTQEEFGILYDDPIWLGAINEWQRRTYPEQ